MSILTYKNIFPKIIEKLPKMAEFWKRVKLANASKNSIFDWTTSFIYDKTHFGMKNGTKFKNYYFSISGPNILKKKNLISLYFFLKIKNCSKMIANRDYIFSSYKDITFCYILPQTRSFYLENCTVGQPLELWKR